MGIVLGVLALGVWLVLNFSRSASNDGAKERVAALATSAPTTELPPAPSVAPRRVAEGAQEPRAAESSVRPPVVVPELAVEHQARFHGLVIDGLTGQPISGARAWLSDSSHPIEITSLDPQEVIAESTSDTRGHFVLQAATYTSFQAYVRADGYGFGSFVVDPEGDIPELPVRVELLPAAELEFRVRDVRGEPLPVIDVGLDLLGEEEFGRTRSVRRGRGSWKTTTDEQGRARFAGLPPERVLAWKVSAGDALREDRIALGAGEQRRVEVVFGSGARIFGSLRDQHRALVPGLELWVARPSEERRFHSGRKLVARTKSDELGRFELADLPYEPLVIGPASDQEDFVPRATPVVVDGAVVALDLVVTRGLAISGRVVGTKKDLASVASVIAVRHDGDLGWAELTQNGSFRISPLEPGEYLVYGWGVGSGTEVQRQPAGAGDVELDIVAPRTVSIRVENGGEDLEFRVHDLERGTFEWSERDSGTFEWAFSPGTFELLATTLDGRVGLVPRIEVGDVEPRGEVVVALEPGASVTLVHAATSGLRALRLFVGGVPFALPPLNASSSEGLVPGAAETLLVPAGELRAELLEGERVVAGETVTLLSGERRRIVLAPR